MDNTMQNEVRFSVLALAGYFKAERLVGEACEDLSERYTFTGKELDEESNLYYYDARYNSSTYSQFTTIDPMSDKYPSINPYLYCAGNPIKYVDPDGRRLIIANDDQELFKQDLEKVFGKDAMQYVSFDSENNLQISKEFGANLSKDQRKLYAKIKKINNDPDNVTLQYRNTYTNPNDGNTIKINGFPGGGLTDRKSKCITISPDPIKILTDLQEDFYPFSTFSVEQNRTTLLFHEIGEYLTKDAEYRPKPVDLENIVRSILKMPLRPYDLWHSPVVPTQERKR